ncbi:MAG: metal-dependent hydrolase [Gammaproteobacteria bacterium]|nr:metal-dependent hydrolase [Gammaproteobacteria bacterium]
MRACASCARPPAVPRGRSCVAEALAPNPHYRYEPKQVDAIVIRPFDFDFPDDLDPVWAPGARVRSLMFNGFSLTMPYLEPYLIKSMQAASLHIKEPRLLEDIRAFNGQEARHYQCHRRLNELIKKNGYPELAEVEARLAKSYERLLRKPLETQLAYNAGFETMTNGFTRWFINRRRALWGGNCPWVSSFWVMHMVEETEHKTVAFDTYMAYSGRYLPRAIGVFHGSFHVLGYGLIAMVAALKKDGLWPRPRTLWEIVREVGSLLWNVGPYLLRGLLPSHNPRCDEDPEWQKAWIAGYKTLPPNTPVPLLDTRDPDIPVPFTTKT